MMATEPNWAEIEATVFAWEDQCWLTCNGGYCCGNSHPKEFNFRIFRLDASAIVYLGEEYDWMVANGAAPPSDMRKREFSFDFGGPRPLRAVVVDCDRKGLCEGCLIKPLQCRIYPFIPVFDDTAKLVDLYPGSMYDLTFLKTDDQTPCTVWQTKREPYLVNWQKLPAFDLLRHPLIMFYFAAYKAFADIYLEMLGDSKTLAGLEGEDFWSAWEFQYLGRKLFDIPRIKSEIFAIYQQFEARYGDFFPAAAAADPAAPGRGGPITRTAPTAAVAAETPNSLPPAE